MSKRAFRKYFEWIDSTIYIRVNGEETAMKLEDLLKWFYDNRYDLDLEYRDEQTQRLKEELHALWDRHNRLLAYLELEDVTIPDTKIIRKIKKEEAVGAGSPTESVANTKPEGES